MGFHKGSDSEDSACNTGDLDLIPGLGRSGEGNGNPLQCSCLGNSMGREAWQAIVHRVAKKNTPHIPCPDNPDECVGWDPGTESVAAILEDTRSCHRVGGTSGMGH